MFASSRFSEKVLGTFACFNVLHSVLSSVAALHLNHQLNLNLGKYQKQSLAPLQSLVIPLRENKIIIGWQKLKCY